MLSLICWRIFIYIKTKQPQLSFQLDEQGQWSWLNEKGVLEHWQITDSSRVAVYGCYLTLNPKRYANSQNDLFYHDSETRTYSKQQFIFKDSLSIEDYARLCRVIRRINL